MITPDTDSLPWFRFIVACIIVVGLMGLLALMLRYIKMRGFGAASPARTGGRRLHIIEGVPLDLKRRLVIVRCDDAEHLLLLGLNQDVVIEANLNKTALPSSKNKTVA
jgi:flagellar protein FliO/FliZ